jgi:hypothetical protein
LDGTNTTWIRPQHQQDNGSLFSLFSLRSIIYSVINSVASFSIGSEKHLNFSNRPFIIGLKITHVKKRVATEGEEGLEKEWFAGEEECVLF